MTTTALQPPPARQHLPRWIKHLAWMLLAGSSLCAHPAGNPEAGLMLRSGNWDGDIGTYEVPAALRGVKPANWPADGWQQMTLLLDRAYIEAAPAAVGRKPRFLSDITRQLDAGQAGRNNDPTADNNTAPVENIVYLRMPGPLLRQGVVMLHRFRNGTSSLVPILDHRYELTLGTQPYAFTVRNGRKDAARTADGAHVTVEYDGQRYEYLLGEFGWDARIQAIGDFDGDGKPDFLINVGGNNSLHEYLLLSSRARPGANPPSASLHATGC